MKPTAPFAIWGGRRHNQMTITINDNHYKSECPTGWTGGCEQLGPQDGFLDTLRWRWNRDPEKGWREVSGTMHAQKLGDRGTVCGPWTERRPALLGHLKDSLVNEPRSPGTRLAPPPQKEGLSAPELDSPCNQASPSPMA